MGRMERLEAWLRDEQQCPPVLYHPEATVANTGVDDSGRGFQMVRRELRRVGRLALELHRKLDSLAVRDAVRPNPQRQRPTMLGWRGRPSNR